MNSAAFSFAGTSLANPVAKAEELAEAGALTTELAEADLWAEATSMADPAVLAEAVALAAKVLEAEAFTEAEVLAEADLFETSGAEPLPEACGALVSSLPTPKVSRSAPG